MSITITQSDKAPCHWQIEGEMTIFNAMELKGELLKPLCQCAELELDLAGVSEMDAAGMQLLILAKREGKAQGRTVVFRNHSPAVLEVMDLCQLEGFFGDPVLIRPKEHSNES